MPSEVVRPPRIFECPIQLEGVVNRFHQFGQPEDFTLAMEIKIVRTYIDEELLSDAKRHYVDADKWNPLIMSFCEFYGLGKNLHPSRLAKVY